MLKQILSEFLLFNGVTAAAVIGRDGFVIDVAQTVHLDPDALGALGSHSVTFFEKNGALLEAGNLRQMMFEYRNGAIILTPLTRDEFLMVLTDTTTGLAHVTFQIARSGPRIAAAM